MDTEQERQEFEKWYYEQKLNPITSVKSLWKILFPLWLKLRTLEREKVELENSASTEQYLRFEAEKKIESLTAQLTQMAEALNALSDPINGIMQFHPQKFENSKEAFLLAQSILKKKGENI